jgi:hypothetical protein
MKKEAFDLLKDQGLEASIRNKLVIIKNIPPIFKKYMEEIDPVEKEKILKHLSKSIKELEKTVEEICESFSIFEIKLKPSHDK